MNAWLESMVDPDLRGILEGWCRYECGEKLESVGPHGFSRYRGAGGENFDPDFEDWHSVEQVVKMFGKGRRDPTTLRALLIHVFHSGGDPDEFALMPPPGTLPDTIARLGLGAGDINKVAILRFLKRCRARLDGRF
jgi:hypothetical protein